MKKTKNKSEIIEEITQPRIELKGNTMCVVEGIKSIIKYTPELIQLNMKDFCLSFVGDNLYIDSFSYNGAIIQGTILSIGFGSND